MIKEKLQKLHLKQSDLAHFLKQRPQNLAKAIERKYQENSVYQAGLNIKFKEFLSKKIVDISEVLDELDN
jgi:hypothetical protein